MDVDREESKHMKNVLEPKDQIPKLLKDVRFVPSDENGQGETYFLYEINGKEQWINEWTMNELKIELPSVFKPKEKKTSKYSLFDKETIEANLEKKKNYSGAYGELDAYSIFMNKIRRNSIKIVQNSDIVFNLAKDAEEDEKLPDFFVYENKYGEL